MKTIGFVKKIDELGRIVVPKEVRRVLGVTNLESVQFVMEGNSVVIKKFIESCCFCDSTENLTAFKDSFICEKCKKELTNS